MILIQTCFVIDHRMSSLALEHGKCLIITFLNKSRDIVLLYKFYSMFSFIQMFLKYILFSALTTIRYTRQPTETLSIIMANSIMLAYYTLIPNFCTIKGNKSNRSLLMVVLQSDKQLEITCFALGNYNPTIPLSSSSVNQGASYEDFYILGSKTQFVIRQTLCCMATNP